MNKTVEEMNVSHDYDNELSRLTEKGLNWLPWVGKEYSYGINGKKLLIVGESHYYSNIEKKNAYEEKKITQYSIWESCINKEWRNKTFDNIQRVLVCDCNEIGSKVWDYVAYYNFCQIPVFTAKQRPTPQVFNEGYGVFIELINVLKPTHCLFIGSQALKTVNQNQGNILKIEVEKIGKYYGRKTDLVIDNRISKLVSIKHAGKFFSWDKWNEYLNRNLDGIPEYLLAKSKISNYIK